MYIYICRDACHSLMSRFPSPKKKSRFAKFSVHLNPLDSRCLLCQPLRATVVHKGLTLPSTKPQQRIPKDSLMAAWGLALGCFAVYGLRGHALRSCTSSVLEGYSQQFWQASRKWILCEDFRSHIRIRTQHPTSILYMTHYP